MGRRIETHFLQTGIGQSIEPSVELGKSRPQHFYEGLRGERRINAWERLAAR